MIPYQYVEVKMLPAQTLEKLVVASTPEELLSKL